ncbi:MAG: NTP transferase domain-containing protein [Deltaproteobacteria bacterium]|jgi:NDP-sugar pyrophosphorylase family protein|nr:NTP transferase domain-containing protein [Deltaproteobacteria bacterium]
MLPVVILAGGLATRLGKLSEGTPKSLIDIQGEPFIFHQLRLLRHSGVEKVKILLGHLGEKIQNTVGTGENFGLEVTYSSDGPNPLGTGGAILNALPTLPGLFLILYGDSYLEVDYREVAKTFLYSGKLGLMTVYKNDNQFEKSNVIFQNNLVKLYDKNAQKDTMAYVDYGLICLTKEAIANWPKKKFDLSEVLTELSIKKELAGMEITNRFYEVGSLAGIEDLKKHLSFQS